MGLNADITQILPLPGQSMVYPPAFFFFVFLSSVDIQDGLLSTVRLAASVGAGGSGGSENEEYRLGEYALRDAAG